MASLNLSSVLEHPARLTPDRVAVSFGAQQLTYAQLNATADRVAAGLHALGIRAGDHVALSCPNLPWFPIAYFGILKAGAVVVPLNVLLKPREIAYHLRDSHAKACIAFEGTAELPIAAMARAACAQSGCPLFIVMPADPAAPARDGDLTLPAMMRDAASFEAVRREAGDTAVILYTSGTTGSAKGAELTHGNMVTNAVTCHDMFKPAFDNGADQHVTLVTLPLFHSTAQTAQMNAGFYGGFRLVLMPRFDPAAVLDAFTREQIGLWVGVPTMYWTLLQHARGTGADVSRAAASLRVCASGGAPMPVEVLYEFERTFNARILEGYGLSETAPVAAFNQLQRPSRPGTVGLPIFGVEIRCVDEHDTPVAVGERGEVVVRGPNVMKGYYDRPEATAEAMRGGWFRTGDIGQFDADGYLAIVDRKKDMILRGGFNVYPREIEEVLMTHPAVSLAAVIGVPDARLGEEVKAFVVLKPGSTVTADELVAWSREQMASFKYPRSVEVRESLPVGATGKVLKRELRGEQNR
ncbi:MAG TPA: long-chain fatty acid--CoA ligase [Vicinamibacterales bacterium]|nr:long-chain fatty acid--CoA ligase [Vicinamibacterales bacterium]